MAIKQFRSIPAVLAILVLGGAFFSASPVLANSHGQCNVTRGNFVSSTSEWVSVLGKESVLDDLANPGSVWRKAGYVPVDQTSKQFMKRVDTGKVDGLKGQDIGCRSGSTFGAGNRGYGNDKDSFWRIPKSLNKTDYSKSAAKPKKTPKNAKKGRWVHKRIKVLVIGLQDCANPFFGWGYIDLWVWVEITPPVTSKPKTPPATPAQPAPSPTPVATPSGDCNGNNSSGSGNAGTITGNCNKMGDCNGRDNCIVVIIAPPCDCEQPSEWGVINITTPEEVDNDGETYPVHAKVSSTNGHSITVTFSSTYGSFATWRYDFVSTGVDQIDSVYKSPKDALAVGRYDQIVVTAHDNTTGKDGSPGFSDPFQIHQTPMPGGCC